MLNNIDNRSRNIKEYILFFIVAYGVCWSVGILNYCKKFMSGDLMAIFMMTLPATGVSIAKLYRNINKDENRKIHFTFVGCFVCFIVLILFRIRGIIDENFLEMFICYILLPIESVLILIFALLNEGEFNFGRNWKNVKWDLIIFIFTLIAGGIISNAGMEFIDFSFIVTFPINYLFFFLQGAAFLGEEYGWRGFLQEKMQRKCGKRIGVIFLGIIWEIWHMPIWFSVYHVDGVGLALRFLSTMSFAIIIGFVYMKSNNIWVCAFMHYSINLFSTVFPGNINSYNLNVEHITSYGVVEVLFLFVVFSLFLCTKYYKKDKSSYSE